MVEGPISPGVEPRDTTVSITAIIISGADDPRAMRLRFATLAFQTSTVTVLLDPSAAFLFTSFSKLVMTCKAGPLWFGIVANL